LQKAEILYLLLHALVILVLRVLEAPNRWPIKSAVLRPNFDKTLDLRSFYSKLVRMSFHSKGVNSGVKKMCEDQFYFSQVLKVLVDLLYSTIHYTKNV